MAVLDAIADAKKTKLPWMKIEIIEICCRREDLLIGEIIFSRASLLAHGGSDGPFTFSVMERVTLRAVSDTAAAASYR